MNKAVAHYFAEQDNRPPPGVKRMVVRRTETHRFGAYRIVLATSCGSEKRHIAGSARIQLFDSRSDEPDKPVATKRLQISDWREAQDEMRRLEHALRGKVK